MSGFCHRSVGLALLVSVLVGPGAEVARAQFPQRPQYGNRQERGRRQGMAEQSNLPPVTAFGTVEAMAPWKMQITTDSGQAWLLQFLPNSEVNVMGTAAPEFLAPGQYVSFNAHVDKHSSRVDEKIARLKIFTPNETRILGAFPRGTGAFAAGEGSQAESREDSGAGEAPPPGTEPFQIAGRISSVKNGKLVVLAPNQYFKPSLKLELAEKPEIELDITGSALYQLARKGDKVEAGGSQLAPQVMQVHEAKVILSEPLGGIEKKRRKGGAASDSGDENQEKSPEKKIEKEEKEGEKT